jgi:hypothetical protein
VPVCRHSLLLIIAGSFVLAAAIFLPGPRKVRFRIADFLDFRLFVVPNGDIATPTPMKEAAN